MSRSDSITRVRLERRVFYAPRLRSILLAFAGIVLAGLCLLALFSGATGQSEIVAYALIAVILLSGGVSAGLIYRLTKRRPVVVMEPDGMTVWMSSSRPEFVDWDAITDLNIFTAPRMQVLGITQRPVHSHWADKAVFWKAAERSHSSPELAIPSVCIAAPLRKVEAEIRRRMFQ